MMTGFSLDANKLNPANMTLNLRRDNQGYYWEIDSGQDTGARFSDAKDAIAEIMNIWCTGYDTSLLEIVISRSLNKKQKAKETYAKFKNRLQLSHESA